MSRRTKATVEGRVLWYLAGALAIVLVFKHDTIWWTVTLLALLWLSLFIPALQIRAIKDTAPGWSKRLSVAIAVLVVTAAVVIFGINVWPEKKYLDLSAAQKDKFVAVLQQLQPNKRVVLACAADENVCASVSQFLDLFHKAKWRVRGDSVERGILGKPEFGITILLHGSGTIPDPDDPTFGLWIPVFDPERECLIRALDAVHVSVGRTMADAKLSESEIALVFGPPPSSR